jgi:hypothetical protein
MNVMHSRLTEYQTKQVDLSVDDGKDSNNRSGGGNKSKKVDEYTPLSLTQFRNSRVRHEVLRDLSPLRSPTRRNRSGQSGHERPSIRVMTSVTGPSSPTSVGNPVSPSKAKNVGVHIGFQLNMIVATLKRVIEENNADSQRIFMRNLKRRADRIRCVETFVSLLQRKKTNILFHGLNDLENVAAFESVENSENSSNNDSPKRPVPMVLPLGTTHPLAKIPPHVYDMGSGLNRFAAVGRITGVLLSIIRIQKIAFMNEIIRLRFDKLYFIRALS